MKCRVTSQGVIVCGVKQAPLCRFCRKQLSTKLCDFKIKVGDVGHTGTCDAPMCHACATAVGVNKDYCPVHKITLQKSLS